MMKGDLLILVIVEIVCLIVTQMLSSVCRNSLMFLKVELSPKVGNIY